MGLFGGSSKKSSTSTNQTDRRMVIGERSTAAGVDNTKLGKQASLTQNTANYITDGGAFDLVDGLVRNTLASGAEANRNALAFADGVTSNAMGLAYAGTSDALARSLGFADGVTSNAMGLASDSTGRALNFADGALSSVFGLVSDAMNKVQSGLSTAADAAASSASMAKDAYADAKGRGAMTDYLLLAAVVVMGIVAVRARGD